MKIETIRRAQQARPFQPFALHLADQRVAHVPHPELIYFPPGNVTMIVSLEPPKPQPRRKKAG